MKVAQRIYMLFIALMFTVMPALGASDVRIKDVSTISGVEELQLFGYGLVVGLAGTGDRSNTVFTTQTIRNMLKNMGVELPDRQIVLRNVAAVMVTGTLNPFKKKGTRFDVTVSSVGDAKSLSGGILIMTTMQGPDGNMYATAQGALSTGGYDVNNSGLSSNRKNHVMVGRIPDGAIVQNEYAFNDFSAVDLAVSLDQPDFTSAVTMAKAINGYMAGEFGFTNKVAKALDASTVALDFYSAQNQIAGATPIELPEFLSLVENVTFQTSSTARVVLNERTGTIVAGGNVKISEIAVTHGGIKVEIVNRAEVIQPHPFTMGTTETITNPDMIIEEKEMDMVVLDENASVADLSQSLNSLGVSSRDIIAIFQAIKEAGALQAQLIVM